MIDLYFFRKIVLKDVSRIVIKSDNQLPLLNQLVEKGIITWKREANDMEHIRYCSTNLTPDFAFLRDVFETHWDELKGKLSGQDFSLDDVIAAAKEIAFGTPSRPSQNNSPTF